MDPEIGAELLRVFQESENGEEFINRIMIGDCPAVRQQQDGRLRARSGRGGPHHGPLLRLRPRLVHGL